MPDGSEERFRAVSLTLDDDAVDRLSAEVATAVAWSDWEEVHDQVERILRGFKP